MAKVLSLPHCSPRPWALGPVLELAPCAMAVWSTDRSACALNYAARQMTGCSDFSDAQHLWMARIHPDDQQSFVTFWKELESAEKRLTCDYRFFRGLKDEVRIRDNSVSLRNSEGKIDTIISIYTDVSDLTANQVGEDGAGHHIALIRPLLHEMQNSLHVIRMGIDLMSIDPNRRFGMETAVRGIDCLDRVTEELREYFVPINDELSAQQPEILLQHVLHCLKGELQRHGVTPRISGESHLPSVEVDQVQFRRALKHILEFCQILAKGGELEIKIRQRTIDAQPYVEFAIVNSSPVSLEIDEKTAFQPFLRINGIQIGLGMAIAQQILRRQQGNILFRKQNSQQALISILLKVCSEKQTAPAN